mmetsp:Transcript_18521/g.34072  ORF Transcript_18521/g.34072 Transcript_18521/m.34072 type:complete len:289 (+) Transcript_18521:45-911(+)|eukprot:CAMPEP_0201865928 /NCGR_PEP_ID=MMETSP0902-20130614/684_1 /ASSEMBLY_ACC=CAM_ASM_000551 /TAXON_ID=420261 /ORGANISM="Thalassiosira antarctica, Strain CCMP982" /LENGTH=288 /DNA_ID=CAMNT_0048390797 /DNA_START=23 /DNA_END=889 /DNA_ORIENTATION=+
MAPTSFLSAACTALAILSPASAFAPSANHASRTSSLSMSKDGETTRRGFMDNLASASVAIAGASSVLMTPAPAMAMGLNKVNTRLASYGLPALAGVPNGYSALAEIYGKGANRSPLLVAFGFPLDWVVTLPSEDVNGEDGTIQAGEYAKGDTATFFVVPNQSKVENIQDKDKGFFKESIIAAISQKGSSVYQDFKIIKTEPVTVDNGKYVLVDFKYTLLTGAGFEVERQGVASVTSAGDGVQLLWAASIAARYRKKTEVQLRNIVQSFRVYSDGLNFSADLRPAPDAL